jgi:hypothetical protein
MKIWPFSKKNTKTKAFLEIIPQISGHRVQQLSFKQVTLLAPYLFLTLQIVILSRIIMLKHSSK